MHAFDHPIKERGEEEKKFTGIIISNLKSFMALISLSTAVTMSALNENCSWP